MSLGALHIEERLWPAVWKLLRIRLIISWSSFKRSKIRAKIGMIVIVLFFIGLLVLAFLGSHALLDFLRSPQFSQLGVDAAPIIRMIPNLLITVATLFIFLTSFSVLLQALYLSGDMEFLLSTPVPIRAVFISKLIQAILPNFGLICLIALPVMFGLGSSYGYSIWFYILTIIVLAVLALAAASLSSLVVMSVSRVVSPRRVAEVIGFIVAAMTLVCSQSGQLFNHMDSTIKPDQVAGALNTLSRFNVSWSPITWAGQGLVGIGEGNWLSGIGLTLLTLVLGSGIFIVALLTAEKLYYTGWARVQGSWRKKKKTASKTKLQDEKTNWVEKRISSPIRAIIVKDFLLLRRDLRHLSQVLSPLIFGVVYAIVLLRSGGKVPQGQGSAPVGLMNGLQAMFTWGDVALAAFVSWSLASNLASMAFSQEGKNYWMLKSSPVNTKQLLVAKFLVAYIPSVIIGWFFVTLLALLQPEKLASLWYGWLTLALSLAGVIGIVLTFGVTGARFNWDSPQKMQNTGVGCLSAFLSFVYFGVSLGFFLGPIIVLSLLGIPILYGQIGGIILGGGLAAVCAYAPLRGVREKVQRLNEE
jgi:ABC-2 type transport system permease protein